ncbi:unnamed protein product [Calypogeia fissa]
MSSGFVFSSGPSRNPPLKTTNSSPQPAPPAKEHQRPLHSVKKEPKSATGGSSSSSKDREPWGKAEAPLSLQGQVIQVLAMAVVAWLVATGGFKAVEWVQQQLKPFCDSNSTSVGGIQDDCIPCPEHGSCRDGALECFVGYKRVGKSCVEDKEIDQTAEKLLVFLTNHICGLAASAVCDGASGAVRLTDDEAQAYLIEQGVKEQLGLADKSWQLVWEKMAGIAAGSIAKLNDLDGKRTFSCPTEFVQKYKPLKCKIREWIWANLLILVLTSPVVFLGTSSTIKCVRHRKITARAQAVYLQVCEALEERALESRDMGEGEPWVVVSRLRDHVLLPSERKWKALWKQIEDFVTEDSRIDQYQMKVKGEMKIVWEWQVEGALRTPNVRKKVLQKTQSPMLPPQQ